MRQRRQQNVTTMLVLGMVGLAAVGAALASSWFLLRVMLWVVFLPLMLLKGLFGLVFGLIFGAFGLIVGLVATLAVGVVGLLALLAVFALPLLPLLCVAALVWLGVKGTA